MSKGEAAEVLSIQGREVRVTHPEKPYFSKQTKLSKLDIVRYYLSVAPGALGGIEDRPLVLKRFVDGAEARNHEGDEETGSDVDEEKPAPRKSQSYKPAETGNQTPAIARIAGITSR